MHSPLRMRSFRKFLKGKSRLEIHPDLSFSQQLVFLDDDIHCICYGKLYVSAVQLCMQ